METPNETKRICTHCNKALKAIGNQRNPHSSPYQDWNSRAMHKKCYKHHKEILSIEMKVEEWKNRTNQWIIRQERNIEIKQQLHEIHMKVMKEVTRDLQQQLDTMLQESQARNHIVQQQIDDLMHDTSD